MRRHFIRREPADVPGILLSFRLPLLHRRAPLQDTQVVEEEPSVKVIDLVLEATREELAALDLEGPAISIQRAHDDASRALHVAVDLGNRQAPLLTLDAAFGGDD